MISERSTAEATTAPRVKTPASAGPAPSAAPAENRPQPKGAPAWLQLILIVGLFGAALFVAMEERYLWATLLAIAGTAFGLSFLLRRMVGDEYGRT